MSLVAKVYSVAPIGFEGFLVEVESDATKGLPGLQIVGLGNKAILDILLVRLQLILHPPSFLKTVPTSTCLLPLLS